MGHTPLRERGRGAHLPVSLWRMASATPDLRLPSQPQGVTAPWSVPNYTAWATEAHVCEQLTQGCYLKVERPGVEPATSE